MRQFQTLINISNIRPPLV